MQRMLQRKPEARISAAEALKHVWISEYAEIQEESLIAPELIKDYIEQYQKMTNFFSIAFFCQIKILSFLKKDERQFDSKTEHKKHRSE